MSLMDLARNLIAGPGVSLAGPMRTPIQVIPVTGRTAKGPTYGDPEDDVALVENVSQMVVDATGTSSQLSTAKFTFLEPRAIKEGDRIVLNGVTSTVVKVGGLLDENGVPYVPEVWTGSGAR